MSTYIIPLLYRISKRDFPKLSPFVSWSGIMISPQRLKLLMSRTIFHGPKYVRAIEVRLTYGVVGWCEGVV